MLHPHEVEEREFGFHGALWDADPDVCCAAFQLGACAHTEGDLPDGWDGDDEPPALTPEAPGLDLTAVFVRVAHAEAFVARYAGIGAAYAGMVRKGRTVTWTVPGWYVAQRNAEDLFQDLLENVGYFGAAPLGKVATLNGHPAPRTY